MRILPLCPIWTQIVSKFIALILTDSYTLLMEILGTSQELLRSHLRRELLKRHQRNPKYSLRAFAKHLDLEPSYLSKLLQGKRMFNSKNIGRLEKKLGLSLSQTEPQNFQNISSSAIYDNWHALAILEFLLIKNAGTNEKSISRSLGISLFEAREALNLLEKLGHIKGNRLGNWKLNNTNTSSIGIPASEQLKNLQRRYLSLADIALDEVAPELRDQSGITMAIDIAMIPKAKECIKKFRRELCALMQEHQKFNSVYQLSISFFPLTKITANEE